ncbi:DUF3135 domain-containing protein [Photobacterium aphoticum]|uniref:DUF3135 domain-containing protein n=1 Tax=Photobacterium aphoticum TaxID=754436 RepID=A0A0J1GIY8_9GAMM|nr:DUF3135 domain-containing protein [Photobacterium aphoticum]KLU99654.1 hypothetical protein ABT58_16340 [Photobacterium aphoticum]PSU53882.1 DUF3135 domain-containing protein [Photobacterium aphoticum]GHA44056.1 hypothetical protein GCM10007086_17170 [Photobacterium aphoticum]
MDDLPDFDTLKQLANDDPEALEALRLRMSEAIIANASDAMKPRLQAQLSHINHVIARGRNPNHTNMLLMSELQQQLKRFALAVTTPEALTAEQATVHPFVRPTKDVDSSNQSPDKGSLLDED